MNTEKTEDGYIEELLGQLPEQEPPPGLKREIMARISSRRTTLRQRLAERLMRPYTLHFVPLRFAFTLGVAVFAFWAGTAVNYPQPEEKREERLAISTFSDDAMANYWVGRGLLAGGQAEPAVNFLRRAAELDPGKAEFAHWQGVAYWALGDPEKERQSYLRTMEKRGDYVPTLLNLGHNYLENGNYASALQQYRQALQQQPDLPEALYNTALAYHKLADDVEAQQAFRHYLHFYREGKWAHRAVEHLQRIGDFSFRSYRIGNNHIVLSMQALLDAGSLAQEREVAQLAKAVLWMNSRELHVVVYDERGNGKARTAALNLKRQLINNLGTDYEPSVKVSWFDAAEPFFKPNGTKQELSPSLLIFTRYQQTEKRRNSI